MKAALISAAMLGVVHVTVPVTAAAAPVGHPAPAGEGADGGRGVTLARAGAASFLGAPETRQSPLVAVGEGGEGGRGRRWRRWRRGHGYYRGHPYYVVPAPPPPAYYYVVPPPPPPPPPVHVAPRRPSVGVWVDPGG